MELRTDWDDLLWETGTKVSGPGAVEPSKEELAAYREGRLSSEEAEKLERALSQAAGSRRQLAELAGIEPTLPDPRVREAFLARFDHATRSGRRARLAVQAALVAMGFSVLWFTRSPESLPADLAYDVRAEGLATVRRPPPASRRVEAYPDHRDVFETRRSQIG
jgi:ferric-dicitrate binding protein FerR (iron transport regulator)